MAKILVLYDTRSGNTQKMAAAVAEGAPSEQELASCRILGAKLVTHVKRVKGE